jgi:5,10-methylene-tetrahydrofolate dehydrogenase/methenyl tetrahydrofolate cyclohydrolase
MDNRLLNGKAVRARILGEVAAHVTSARAKHDIGRLVSVSIGEHKEVAVYVRGQDTLIPAASSAAILEGASPLPPEMIAPA